MAKKKHVPVDLALTADEKRRLEEAVRYGVQAVVAEYLLGLRGLSSETHTIVNGEIKARG